MYLGFCIQFFHSFVAYRATDVCCHIRVIQLPRINHHPWFLILDMSYTLYILAVLYYRLFPSYSIYNMTCHLGQVTPCFNISCTIIHLGHVLSFTTSTNNGSTLYTHLQSLHLKYFLSFENPTLTIDTVASIELLRQQLNPFGTVIIPIEILKRLCFQCNYTLNESHHSLTIYTAAVVGCKLDTTCRNVYSPPPRRHSVL